jgi:maleate cis-trans isomerase
MIRARIGVLVPAGTPTVEPEFFRMAPAAVADESAIFDAGRHSLALPHGR